MYGGLKSAARQVLENNTRRYDEHPYFVADSHQYPFQYYWDSCFQAMVMSLFDGARAEAEMYSLLSTQFGDGCMPYLTSWESPRFPWTVFLKVANWIGEDGRANLSTQPMMSAVATWERSAAMVEKGGGYREFYNSSSGRGYGGKSYGMSTLALDMLERLGD